MAIFNEDVGVVNVQNLRHVVDRVHNEVHSHVSCFCVRVRVVSQAENDVTVTTSFVCSVLCNREHVGHDVCGERHTVRAFILSPCVDLWNCFIVPIRLCLLVCHVDNV